MEKYSLFSEEYYQDLINRYIKHEISNMFYMREDKCPTKEQYEQWFKRFVDNAKCEVTNYDLGIYDSY